MGGLKEKLIAALRGGVETVLIPKESERDLKEIPPRVKRKLNLVLVEHMDEVLQHALRMENPAVLQEPLEYPLEDIFETATPVEHPAGVN